MDLAGIKLATPGIAVRHASECFPYKCIGKTNWPLAAIFSRQIKIIFVDIL